MKIVDDHAEKAECLFCVDAGNMESRSMMHPVVDVRLDFLRCPRCGTFRLPEERVKQDRVEPDRVGLSATMRALFSIRLRWLRSQIPELGDTYTNIMDVGCGDGQFLQFLKERGFSHLVGVEPDDLRRKQAERAGVRVFDDLERCQDKADVITLWHVLEHVENPQIVLKNLFDRLRPGGLLLVSIPNHGSLQTRWFGRFSCYLDYGRHLWYWGDSFEKHAREVLPGSRISRMSGINWEYEIFGWVDSIASAFMQQENYIHSHIKKRIDNVGSGLPATLLTGVLFPIGLSMSLLMQLCPERQSTLTIAIRKGEELPRKSE